MGSCPSKHRADTGDEACDLAVHMVAYQFESLSAWDGGDILSYALSCAVSPPVLSWLRTLTLLVGPTGSCRLKRGGEGGCGRVWRPMSFLVSSKLVLICATCQEGVTVGQKMTVHRDPPVTTVKTWIHQENGMLLESTSRDWQHWQLSILVGGR